MSDGFRNRQSHPGAEPAGDSYADHDRDRTVERLRRLAYWMDEAFGIPGTNIRIGLDSIIGFVPGVGDIVTAAFSIYLIREAARLGAPKSLLVRMAWNAGLDAVVGGVPVVGDLFDIGWKANKKNLRLLLDYLDRQPGNAVGRPETSFPRR